MVSLRRELEGTRTTSVENVYNYVLTVKQHLQLWLLYVPESIRHWCPEVEQNKPLVN